MIISKVDTNRARTATEEREHILDQMDKLGNFFAWDVHPNRLRSNDISRARLYKKLLKVVQSEEFLHENPLWRTTTKD